MRERALFRGSEMLRLDQALLRRCFESSSRASIRDQLGDADEFQLVLRRKAFELGATRHGAVVVDDLSQGADGSKARELRQVDRSFGMPGASEYALCVRSKGEDMTRPREVRRLGR